MSEQQTPSMTPVDALICDDSIQTMKACIPFMGIREQSILLSLTKFMEFKRSIQLIQQDTSRLQACSIEPAMRTPIHMLNHIRSFCSDTQKTTIDAILNTMQIFQLYQMLQNQSSASGSEESLMSMMSEEQRQMFRQFSETVQMSNQTQGGLYES